VRVLLRAVTILVPLIGQDIAKPSVSVCCCLYIILFAVGWDDRPSLGLEEWSHLGGGIAVAPLDRP